MITVRKMKEKMMGKEKEQVKMEHKGAIITYGWGQCSHGAS